MIDRILAAKEIYIKNKYEKPKFIYLGYSEYQELRASQHIHLVANDDTALRYLVAGLIVYVVDNTSHFHLTG
tara:strand:- start:402 stop:617 length:216 start_codon:yes stop_codon:yes gene_type:complete